jgi:hypothetical protein
MFGGGLKWRPRPTPGCSAIEEEEEGDVEVLAEVRVSKTCLSSTVNVLY